MSYRKAQIESTLKRTISTILAQKLSDPRIEGMVSVTRVSISPDMHDAQVFVTVLPARHQTRTLYGLQHAAVHIHARVMQEVALKKVPHLDFRLDESLKKQAVVDAAIHRALTKERNRPGRGSKKQAKLTGEDASS